VNALEFVKQGEKKKKKKKKKKDKDKIRFVEREKKRR
jgi:hypothetical protein